MSLWVVFAYDQYFFGPYFVTESFTPRHSFLYCLPLFVLGGIIYLYRGDIRGFCGRKRPLALVLRLTGTVLWFALPHGGSTVFYLESLVAMVLWLAYAIGVDSRFLSCRPARGLSGISMELYLAQMVVFRVVQRLGLLYLFGTGGVGGWTSYLVASTATMAGWQRSLRCTE